MFLTKFKASTPWPIVIKFGELEKPEFVFERSIFFSFLFQMVVFIS